MLGFHSQDNNCLMHADRSNDLWATRVYDSMIDCLQAVEVAAQPEQVSMTQVYSEQNLPEIVLTEAPRHNDSKNRNRKSSAAQVTLWLVVFVSVSLQEQFWHLHRRHHASVIL